MKKSFAVSFLFIGTVIGAGFSSGREILTFFSGNLALAPLAVFASGCVFFLASILLLSLSKIVKIADISDLCCQFSPKIGIFLEITLIFFFIIICSFMLSGADSLFGIESTFGISSLMLFFAGCAVVVFGTNGLLKVNFFLVPILLAFILFVSIFHLYRSGIPSSSTGGLNYVTSIFEGVSYASMNLLLSAVILLGAGSQLSKKQIVISSAISAVTISAVILVFLLAMNTASSFLAHDMPIIPMCTAVSIGFRVVAQIAIWIAIFTTFSSSLSVCFEYFKRFCQNPILRFFILFAICYPISRLGFSQIVGIFLPAMGLVGIVLLAMCTSLYKKLKPKKHTHNWNKDEVKVKWTKNAE